MNPFPFNRQTTDRLIGGEWLRLPIAGVLAGAPDRSLPDAWEP